MRAAIPEKSASTRFQVAICIRAIGKTSWADSRYDDEWVASDEESHRFLYGHQYEMNTDGIG